MLNADTLEYIINFLAGEQLPANAVGYTSDATQFCNYKLVIRPSDFFEKGIYGTEKSLPTLLTETLDSPPLLFGDSGSYVAENTLIINADLIASTYFLISRYEEMVNPTRDQHGRFPATASVLHKLNYLHKPLVDEYGQLLRDYLRKCGVETAEPKQEISKIFLTHDVDKISQYRNFRGFVGGILRGMKGLNFNATKTVFKSALSGIKHDPLYTFEWLFEQNKRVSKAETIAFFKANHSPISEDKPCYHLASTEVQNLFALCRKNDVKIGLHASYLAGGNASEIKSEKERLEKHSGKKIDCNRHHFLRTCSPFDMQYLISAGIQHDFTLGFADCAGFRLGTCRAVRWINPQSTELTSLTLHPLTIMECSLDAYMSLSYEQALQYCIDLIEQVKKHNGELVLLWHNTSVAQWAENTQSYQRKLYEKLITHTS